MDPTGFRRCEAGVIIPAFGKSHSWVCARETELIETTHGGTVVADVGAPLVPAA